MEQIEKDKCVMCGNDGLLRNVETGDTFKKLFLATETNELLCEKCFLVNEEIKRTKH